jgi:alpha-L-fucosidase 2
MLLQTHDRAVHLLPALPGDWLDGEISGLRAFGGFEVSFSWEKGKLQNVTIKSNLGGNCRIRVPNEMVLENGTLLKKAEGENPNQFFATPKIKEPLISPSATLNAVKLQPTFLYDLSTEKGNRYTLIFKKTGRLGRQEDL